MTRILLTPLSVKAEEKFRKDFSKSVPLLARRKIQIQILEEPFRVMIKTKGKDKGQEQLKTFAYLLSLENLFKKEKLELDIDYTLEVE